MYRFITYGQARLGHKSKWNVDAVYCVYKNSEVKCHVLLRFSNVK